MSIWCITKGDTSNKPLFVINNPLCKIGSTQPTSGSGVWITNTTANPNNTNATTSYKCLVQRDSVNDAISISVRIVDPLNRSGNTLSIDIPSGPVQPIET